MGGHGSRFDLLEGRFSQKFTGLTGGGSRSEQRKRKATGLLVGKPTHKINMYAYVTNISTSSTQVINPPNGCEFRKRSPRSHL